MCFPSISSLILHLFQFILAIFNLEAILIYLSSEKPIYVTFWCSCVCFVCGASAVILYMDFMCYLVFLQKEYSPLLICNYCFFLFLVSLPCGSCAGLVQRCVIIQKDDNGFGLTVSGDNPVFVQSVKEGKAFFKTVLSLGSKQ